MEEEIRSVDPSTTHLDRIGLATVGTRRLNPSVDTKRRADAECIPGAVGVPPVSLREDPVRGRNGRERVRHTDRVPVGLEDECMGVVEQLPALDYVMLMAEVARGRRTAQLDEGRVRPIAKGDEIRVDGFQPIQRSFPSCACEGQPARVRERSGMSLEQRC